ncbi:hypothetical protein F0562_020278 [Nyssa sinensis]|uniref:COBRA C-terminal domain-containing protein n=1 Tax=Nyssa sinensis TaxID=561372 RepID=A0A5J5BS12_9ASTE|nr:hypothetical protein F0562_020278 [Nyssa sinensis]
MWGAEATEQGNCSAFKGGQLPHCCDKEPVIIDLLPGAPYNKQVANCCKGGVISSMTQDPDKYLAAFQMNIGVSSTNTSSTSMPAGNFALGLPGYTCGDPDEVPPSKFMEDNGRRKTQAVGSLAAFSFVEFITWPGELPPVLQLQPDAVAQPVVQCSQHMCPIKVHWHVKLSYKEYWRVKITVTNLNLVKNYSQWNFVMLHPNLQSVTEVFSFNYKSLDLHGYMNDTGMFYGIQYYNDILLQSGHNGNVQTEMLLHKDPGIFTFREGWAFPRKISFNGDECVMPPPDEYPRLPNSGHFDSPSTVSCTIFFSLVLLLTVF